MELPCPGRQAKSDMGEGGQGNGWEPWVLWSLESARERLHVRAPDISSGGQELEQGRAWLPLPDPPALASPRLSTGPTWIQVKEGPAGMADVQHRLQLTRSLPQT